ncbi:unnamed protein product [Discula destructiva]
MASSSLWAANASVSWAIPASASASAPISTFTTEYCFTAQAADATSTWFATYTITETCTGSRATWTRPSIPPAFTTTVVTCAGCGEMPTTLTITCPVDKTAAATATARATTLTAAVPRPPSSRTFVTEDVWWAGPLLTASSVQTKAAYVTADATTVWGSAALLSGAVTFAVGWLLWKM